ncbi:MAG: GHKL domain-containing protein [Bdellovibrio sp.]|nr:GHKL domain-containing protein [Bdellovibrio sp.]
MTELKQTVLDSLNLDYCKRSVAASVGFIIVFSALLWMPVVTSLSYYPFHQASAGIALVASIARLLLARKISRLEFRGLEKYSKIHNFVVVISTTCLGIICTLGFFDPLNSDAKIFVTSFLISAIAAGSTSSLSLNPKVQVYFLIVVGVIPGIALAFSQHLGDLPYNIWTLFVFTFVLYVYGNSKQFYRNMVYRYQTEEELKVEKYNLTLAIRKIESTQEELLDQKARAEYSAKLASLGEMAGGIAHEINTPLNVILLSAEQQMDLLQDGLTNKGQMKESIEKVQSTTNRIATIVRGLRTFARDGAQDPIESISVHSVIDNTLALCYEKFKLNDIEVRRHQNQENVMIQCRPVQVSQVILNLLNNAFEAIRDLPQKWIRIDVLEHLTDVEIRITDSGDGIPENLREDIFRPFFTTKGIGKGTGLGLSISRGLIESHQGQLFIDGTSTNTSFVIRLPR